MKQLSVLLTLVLMLSSCDVFNQRSANNKSRTVTVSSNATFIALRDGVSGSWVVERENNSAFEPNTRSFVVNDAQKRFSLLFVCESINSDYPSEVFLFHSTISEIKVLDHKCRKPDDTIVRQVISGRVLGLQTTASSKTEVAYFAVDSETQFRSFDSYASKIREGPRDIIGFKGEWRAADDSIIPNQIISKTTTVTKDQPAYADLSFLSGFTRNSFIPNEQSSVSINGTPASGWRAKLNYRTDKKTILTLKDFATSSAQYYGVPLYVTGPDGKATASLFQGNTEGHELVAEVSDTNGRVAFRARRLFKDPQQAVTLTVPQSSPVTANAAFDSSGSARIVVSADSYSDTALGTATLHQWHFIGRAAPLDTVNATTTVISKLEWNVFLSQNWLNNTAPNGLIIEPIVIQKSVSKSTGTVMVDRFKKNWNFNAAESLAWKLHHFVGVTDASAVLDFVLNQDYNDGVSYGETIQYSSPP